MANFNLVASLFQVELKYVKEFEKKTVRATFPSIILLFLSLFGSY